MFKGFYTAASGMLAQQRRTEMLTNNMSNANTPGYKADQSSIRSFPEMLLKSRNSVKLPTDRPLQHIARKPIGALNTGVYVQETNPRFEQGAIRTTNHQTDMAIVDSAMPVNPTTGQKGTVLFAIGTPAGTRYTRNGNFTLDGAGFLTTPNGMYVLDERNQRISLQSDQFEVTPEGYVQENGRMVARLGMAYSNNPSGQLVKEGDGLYRTNGNGLVNAYGMNGVEFTIQQGSIEQSNVDASQTMTEMLTAYRAFEANQKIIQAYDQSMQKAVTEVGRIG